MLDHSEGRLRFLRRANDRPRRNRLRRGVYLLPSLLTMGNMFCGYACVVYAMRGEYETAAPFIGFAVILDILDGRIARMTGTTSAFGVEFDSLADVISFGVAPAILSFAWGLSPLGRLGWAAGFLFVAAAVHRPHLRCCGDHGRRDAPARHARRHRVRVSHVGVRRAGDQPLPPSRRPAGIGTARRGRDDRPSRLRGAIRGSAALAPRRLK